MAIPRHRGGDGVWYQRLSNSFSCCNCCVAMFVRCHVAMIAFLTDIRVELATRPLAYNSISFCETLKDGKHDLLVLSTKVLCFLNFTQGRDALWKYEEVYALHCLRR